MVVSQQRIFISNAMDYALVRFDSMEDAQHAFYTLSHWLLKQEWVVDFEPLDVSTVSCFAPVCKASKLR